ncbi:MAG: arabinogalactan endo-1,4-beta-galactosidase, partial [Nocardiopsaceae bacterium]|nr:arabinogalactan endo-1,4-beta-galactosidase [Nocardiopsaceae bacterium]
MGIQHSGTGGLSRRAFLGGAAGLGAAVALPGWSAAARGMRGDQRCGGFRVSLSVSPVTEAVLGAVSLADGRRTASTVRQVQRLFNRHGATEVFVRVATLRQARVGDAEYGFQRAVERAQLAAQLGMPLNPELGLWDVYGDIRRQPPPDFTDYPSIRLPGPWLTLTLSQMKNALRQYGALVARQLLSTGVQVNYWDLGNEVEWGVAGVAVKGLDPTGYSPPDTIDPAIGQMTAAQLLGMPEADRIAWLRQHLWPYVGRLLAAVTHGVRSVDPAARFSTHLASIGVQDATFHTAFWQAMNQAGYHPAQFGTSLYPTNGDPGDRKAVFLGIASALRQRFSRKLFFAEFGYPSGPMGPPFAWNNTQPGYPQTADGQYRYLRDLVASSAAGGAVAGIRPW